MLINTKVDKLSPGQAVQGSMPTATAARTVMDTAGSSSPQAPASRQSRQIAVLGKWTEFADVSKQIARQEQSERSVRQLYGGLEQLRRQLSNASRSSSAPDTRQAEQLLRRLDQLAQEPGSLLDYRLEPRRTQSDSLLRMLGNKLDLLSVRSQSESIHILFGRSGAGVSIALPAGQSPEQNLASVRSAFAAQHINVAVDPEQGLYFSASASEKRKLQESWMLVGEGVRAAAGNPVTIQLQAPETPFRQLEKQVSSLEDVQAFQHQIMTVQHKLKQALARIQAEQKVLSAQLQQAQHFSVEGEHADLEQLSRDLRQSMNAPGQFALSAVLAQANVTRSLVSSSLA